MKYALSIFLIANSLLLVACEASDPVINSSQIRSNLETQLDEATRINAQSARNHLQQSQNIYNQINGSLITVSTDVDAYRRLSAELLPSMMSVANSITDAQTDEELTQIKTDFQELFENAVSQALQGINNNLNVYQGILESSQTLGPTSDQDAVETLTDLTALFQATEYTERFTAQLAQFPTLLNNSPSILGGIRNQQNVVINGILRIAEQIKEPESLQSAYLTMAQTLTRLELLPSLARLARQAYGESSVALRQTELTPVQSNPSQIQMVVREAQDRYRIIRNTDGRLTNEQIVDTRGLSASDLLYQSNVVTFASAQP